MEFHQYRGATSAPASILLGASDRSPARLNRSLRVAVETEIERLIDMLDAIEPDDEREYDAGDDREQDDADDEDSDHSGSGDYEGLLEQERGEGADLGATEDVDQSAAWASHGLGDPADGEQDVGDEPEDEDGDREPNLSTMRGSGSGSFGFPVDVSGAEYDL